MTNPPLLKTSPSLPPPLPHTTSPFPKTSHPRPKTTTPPSFQAFTPPLSRTTVPSLPKTTIAPLPSTTRPLPKTSTPHPPKTSPHPLPHTAPPLFDREPFIVTWNIPKLVCNRYNISLDTSPYRGVATPAKVPGQFLSLFYTDRLGLYPHVDLPSRQQFYGGIPQRGNLRASLAKARADINYYIPSKTARGLAVIDWEDWRPLWARNWGSKWIYRTLSVTHARQRDRSLTARRATATAKKQFQAAAHSYMAETLSLGSRLRPNYQWGFYLFPNCYNHGWMEPGYTGRCSREVRGQNDELLWLWEASSALYPSIYLQASLGDRHSAALLVRNRVQEALRVSALPARPTTAPVYVYTRPVFIDQNRRFLSQGDLVSTIGESAAVGASGAVLWGASADYDDKASCEALSSYLTTTLNPYVANVTAAAQLCSDFLCQGNGRCVRKHYESDHYLHLSSGNFRILRARGTYMVLGTPSLADLTLFSRRFTCQCYAGRTCAPKLPIHLSKALVFRLKHQGLSDKTKTLNKVIADMEQSTIKENLNKH
ncbi:hyaluronidase PH-20-like [Salmo salar]|uniref:Hyaluronidase n=1 Tax=Salmo salar TaxID=8030 RepID=A0A1S3MZA3_SALSA|nr:hyaluronidase PH-20-like [Salmo salar]|eukprot:XP_014008507.1 PREDICTED: hyaluronidase PH-20-like [Salmo salar]